MDNKVVKINCVILSTDLTLKGGICQRVDATIETALITMLVLTQGTKSST